MPTDALLCKDCNCTNDSHKVALNQLYDDVVAAITMASQNSIHTPGVSRGNDFNCPGWKEFASDFLTRFNKIAIQGTPQMAVDKEAICLSRVYSYYPKCNFPLFYV